jgi:two-component system, sensor histidine kinase and response regulator
MCEMPHSPLDPSRELQPTTMRVLVVEDNHVTRVVAARTLERRGLEVHVAVNGKEALAMHERSDYDLIFMDCQMPELDGYDATREIRRREGADRHTPIIAITASTMPGDHDRCLVAGMDFYAAKPVKAAGLDYVISQALALGAAMREAVAVNGSGVGAAAPLSAPAEELWA